MFAHRRVHITNQCAAVSCTRVRGGVRMIWSCVRLMNDPRRVLQIYISEAEIGPVDLELR